MRGLMNTAPLPPPQAAAAGPAPAPHLLLLGRALLWRLGVVALLVVAWLAYSDWREWRQRTAQALPGTAALAAQLKEGGRLVIPLGEAGGDQTLVRLRKIN